MDLKVIVMDIDGTLLNGEKIISTRTKDKLIEAQKKGIKVVLASGRPTQGMLPLAEELEMDKYEGFLVSYNGSQVYDVKTKEILFNQAIPADLANDILKHLADFNVVPMVDHGEYMYVNNAFFDIDYEVPAGHFNIVHYEVRGGNFKVSEVDDFSTVIKEPVNKILVAGNPDYLEKHHEAMRAPFRDSTTAAFSAPFYFEYTDQGIDKAKALSEVFPDMGITPENMISFGDGQNDRSIIEYAGIGVAMSNAVPEILDLADEVTTSNDEDGIADFLDKFF
ncbi:Cof-type HAD-IIB family hydrolase [Carnobacteriaceae bacterium 52-44]